MITKFIIKEGPTSGNGGMWAQAAGIYKKHNHKATNCISIKLIKGDITGSYPTSIGKHVGLEGGTCGLGISLWSQYMRKARGHCNWLLPCAHLCCGDKHQVEACLLVLSFLYVYLYLSISAD